jgi:hypothetical protein
MLKYAVVLFVVCAVLGAGYYFVSANTPVPESASAEEEHAGVWTFEDAEEANGIPQTRVLVDIHGRAVPVGIFEGHCADMVGSAWTLRDGASSGAICWFAGGGTEIAVFHENGMHVIKTAVLDEGTAEGGSVRGDMVELLSI